LLHADSVSCRGFCKNPQKHAPTYYAGEQGVIRPNMTKEELIQEALRLFPADYRPEHFTDPDHCEECRDHDETLRANTGKIYPLRFLEIPAGIRYVL
jgi:hypothetical protein